ncbi:MAG: thiamine pyrophosphate-binding protein [Caldilineaceae bacterium]|nr:thiamine pyrophosphate-binding protein [Caldilineaceae bacterium]
MTVKTSSSAALPSALPTNPISPHAMQANGEPSSKSVAEGQNLSDLLVAYLEALGVEYVFGVPGGHISALYEALHRSQQRGGPQAILSRHETGAAHMAAGYARETGKLGVCCATTGPGASNLITGLMGAYADHTPLLAITAQSILSKFGAAAFQEASPDTIDTMAMFKPCTLYSTIITHPNQAEQKITAALRHALQPPRGPVHLSIPVDLSRVPLQAKIREHYLTEIQSLSTAFTNPAAVDQLWQFVCATMEQGRRMVIWVGHECAGASTSIMQFAERTGSRVITTQRGKSWVDPYHPLSAGVFGFAGHESAREVLADESVDFILGCGVTLGQWATSTWDTAVLNDKLVHIHPINKYFDHSPMARLHVHGTVSLVMDELLSRLDVWQQERALSITPIVSSLSAPECKQGIPAQITVRDQELYQSDAVPLHPQRLIWELMAKLPSESRFVCDNCNWLAWSFHHLFIAEHQQFHSTGESVMTMGWAIGAAVGMALATPGTPVVCLTGDGTFLMTSQEFTIAVEKGLPVIYVILNDGSYGMVKHRHRQVAPQPLAFDFARVNFAQMAEAMGGAGYAIHTPQDLQSLDFAAICGRSGPTILDVYIDPEAVPPLGMF